MTFTITFSIVLGAFALWVCYHAVRFHHIDARTERQRKCREWIEWKLKEQSSVGHYEAQCAFRALVMNPEWEARGPWEWEKEPASVDTRSRLARELWPHDKGMWH